MRAASQMLASGAAASAPSGSQTNAQRHAVAISPRAALLAPESTSATRRRRLCQCHRRRRSTSSSVASVISASASNSSSAKDDDDDAYPPTKDRSNEPSISFQRTRGEVAASSSASAALSSSSSSSPSPPPSRGGGGGDNESAGGGGGDDDPFRPGDLIEGRYRVESVLGRGALGVTFAVRDEQADGGGEGGEGGGGLEQQQLALKATRLRGRAAGGGGWKAFDLAEREAAALRSLSGHPNIPRFERFFDVDRPDDRVRCLVQGRVRGGRALSAVVASGARASPEDVARLARDILSALAHLASRLPPVTHRDVKPDNIVLEGGEWGGRAFLVDFSGVAAAALAASEGGGEGANSSSSSSSTLPPSAASLPGPGTTVIGTFGFMAPEQFRGAASPASDIYALGATLLFALTGRQPSSFPLRKGLRLDTGSALEAARAPRLLRELVEAALEPSPEDRPTADEALRALEEALGGEKEGGRRGSAGGRGAGGGGDGDEEEEEEGVVFSGRAFGTSAAGSGSGGGGSGGAIIDLERGLSLSSPASSSSSSSSSSGSSSLLAVPSSSSSSSQISLTNPPPGARSKIAARGRNFAVDVPAGPLLAPERAGSAAFAVVWTASVAAWTVTALAAGSLLAAAFSIPFWLSGAAVARDALGGALSGDARLEINPRTWKLVRGKRGSNNRKEESDDNDDLYDLAGALEGEDASSSGAQSNTAVVGGDTSTLRGARVAVTAYVNGVPRSRLEVVDGFNVHVLSEDLSPQEQRWLARAINAAVERATGRRPALAEKKRRKKRRRGDDDSDSDDDLDDPPPPPPPRVFISDSTWGPSGFGGGMWGSDFGDDRFISGGGRGFFGDRTDGFVDDE